MLNDGFIFGYSEAMKYDSEFRLPEEYLSNPRERKLTLRRRHMVLTILGGLLCLVVTPLALALGLFLWKSVVVMVLAAILAVAGLVILAIDTRHPVGTSVKAAPVQIGRIPTSKLVNYGSTPRSTAVSIDDDSLELRQNGPGKIHPES